MFTYQFNIRSLFTLVFALILVSVTVSQPVVAKPAWKDETGDSGNAGGRGKKNKTTTVSIVSAPTSSEVEQGAYVAFSVVAETNDGSNLSYAWYFNGTEIIGATANSYSITQANESDAGRYSVTVSARGIEQSADAILSVVAPELPEFYPIEISSQPISQSLFIDESVTLNVSAQSETPIEYQWRKDGQDILGATQQYFAVESAAVTDSAQYDVVITNGSDLVVSQAATIEVQSLPEFHPIEISLQPVSQTLYMDESVTLNVSAASESPLQYQWRKDGEAVLGATQPHYELESASLSDSAQYDVVVSNGSDFVVSDVATIDVRNLPSVNLSWALPTERVDGSPLAGDEISGFSLYVYDEITQQELKVQVAGVETNYSVGQLDRGRYYFSIATVDNAGLEGPRSDLLSFEVN